MTAKHQLSRAEIVRMHRRQWVQKRQAQSADLAMRRLPPITTRGEAGYVKPKKGIRPNTKRRYQATFNMPGVQVRMPTFTLPRFEAGWRIISCLLSLLLGTALYLTWTQPTFRVVAALVSGNQRLSSAEINAILNSSGQPIFTLIPSNMETRLRLNYPELSSIRITLDLPNTLMVKVSERQPVILWQLNGGYTWIDEDGVAFRPRGSANGLIPVLALAAPAPGVPSDKDPLSPIPYISTDMVKAIETLAPNVPSGTTITFDPRYGLGWSDGRGWRVFFGIEAKDMTLKFQVYQALVASLTQRGIVPVLISVQYPDAPYYRMSQ